MGQVAVSIAVLLLKVISVMFMKGPTGHQLYSLFPGEVSIQGPSVWLANISFFFTCLISNAYAVYKKDSPPASGSDPTIAAKVNNRKTRCLMIIVTCAILAALSIGYRCFVEFDSTSILGSISLIIVSIGLGAGAAAIWQILIKQPNIGLQNMDIFGISQQLISVTQTDTKTMCELVSQ